MMLKLIVDAAINWMQTGLPLRLLKIVIFARDANKPDQIVISIMDQFKKLKEKWLENWKGEKVENVHVYVSNFYLKFFPSGQE